VDCALVLRGTWHIVDTG